MKVHLVGPSVAAGFPSPAEDFVENALDLNEYLIKHPASTFFIRVRGESMKEAGILSGDILIVDRSISAVSGSIVVAVVDGEFTVKRLKKEKNQIILFPENSDYEPIYIRDGQDFAIWGVVVYAIHKV